MVGPVLSRTPQIRMATCSPGNIECDRTTNELRFAAQRWGPRPSAFHPTTDDLVRAGQGCRLVSSADRVSS